MPVLFTLPDTYPDAYKRDESSKIFNYGTAGFRDNAKYLQPVMFRMGILAALRSLAMKGKAIGVMITASHNPQEDNGVKLIDVQGGMLDASWEDLATQLVNSDDDRLVNFVQDLLEVQQVQGRPLVHCAYDTRPSSLELFKAVEMGVSTVHNSIFVSHGYLTTPQLHFIVKSINSQPQYGLASEDGYYSKLTDAYSRLNGLFDQKIGSSSGYQRKIFVDCANGIGGRNFAKLILGLKNSPIKFSLTNVGEGPLNKSCGADFVKVDRKFPTIYTEKVEIEPNQKWCSFDGDADRLVYFYKHSDGSFHLLDGDKIAVLFALFIDYLLAESKLASSMSVGIVQTAYANGNSTKFIRKHFPSVSTYCVPTGVKHLHKQAEELDVGIYFEANGHGTILFSDKLKNVLRDRIRQNENDKVAAQFLCFIDLINEAIGDAMSDLLAVESILCWKNWSLADWDSLYTDIPSKQVKVQVKDRHVIQTEDAERRCVKPEGLQPKIDQTVSGFVNGRAFVRPSGTEDVVRIYAEADDEENVGKLATLVSRHVFDLAGGVGTRP